MFSCFLTNLTPIIFSVHELTRSQIFEERRVRVFDVDVEEHDVIMWVEQVERANLREEANDASLKGIDRKIFCINFFLLPTNITSS